MKNIDIDIEKYNNGKFTIKEIAKIEDVSTNTIYRRIHKYYGANTQKEFKIREHRKDINIEKYIEDYEKGTLSIAQIAKLEKSTYSTIDFHINKYYKKIGKERAKQKRKRNGGKNKKDIDLRKYIEGYESQKLSIDEIAKMEKIHPNTLRSKLDAYYENIGKKRPSFKKEPKQKKVDIEKYIQDYEDGKILLQEIADAESKSSSAIKKNIQNYYKKMGKKAPKIGVTKDALTYFIKIGMTKEQIRENAAKRNILIPDKYFEDAYKELKEQENREIER